MSEKRFSVRLRSECDGVVYSFFDGDKPLDVEMIVDLLNEQQATINELKEENKKLREEWEFSFRTELAHHRVAEKELQEKIREQQATIEQLKRKCFELEKDYILETSDISDKIYLEDEIKELKEKYGVSADE